MSTTEIAQICEILTKICYKSKIILMLLIGVSIDDVDTTQRSLTSSSMADLIQILLKFTEICNCFGPPNLPGTAQCKRLSWQMCANSAKKWFVYLYRTEHFGKVNAPDTGEDYRRSKVTRVAHCTVRRDSLSEIIM